MLKRARNHSRWIGGCVTIHHVLINHAGSHWCSRTHWSLLWYVQSPFFKAACVEYPDATSATCVGNGTGNDAQDINGARKSLPREHSSLAFRVLQVSDVVHGHEDVYQSLQDEFKSPKRWAYYTIGITHCILKAGGSTGFCHSTG